ncbi:MAG: Ig-like domain-containing protein, partial [Sphingomonas bacterium]|nr:Ig-like domain-containing protein [Sphingomonas bacterium]
MRYEDASQTGSFNTENPVARDDSDALAAGARGPATGNVITGEGTQTGSLGADLSAGAAQITSIAGASGSDQSFSGGKLSAIGEFGKLSVDAQGNYSYLANKGAPENARDHFTYKLADAQGNSDTATLTIEIGKSPAMVQANAEQIVVGPDGVVVLPAGVQLSDIHVVGRNLVIDMPDGTQKVIIDGAVFVPQLVLDDVQVPATNLAALLIDSEPKPAAGGLPPSGGGNFEVPVSPLDPGVPLGDLIPPTVLDYTPPVYEEVGVEEVRPDNAPSILIETPDQPAGAENATATVDEGALPARVGPPAEPEGSHSASTAETTTGTIVFTSPDGPNVITINGVVVTGPGQPSIPGLYGSVIITSFSNGEIGYSYKLADNTSGNATQDVFDVVITDGDGDSDTATLTISIIDDAPIAALDTDSIAAGAFGPATGNVITDASAGDAGDSDTGKDNVGADGAVVVGVAAGNTGAFLDSAGTVAVVIQGAYGKLTLNGDGSYSYTRDAGTAGGVSDVFTYTIKDGDGDLARTTLTIAIGDGGVTTTVPAPGGATTTVYEAALAARGAEPQGTSEALAGGANDDPTEAVSGTIAFSAVDGLGSISLGGTVINLAGAYPQIVATNATGTLVVTGVSYTAATGVGSIAYTYTLLDNTLTDPSSASFALVVTDADGDVSPPANLVISIIDDAPIAALDSLQTVAEDAANIGGNVRSNDLQGADGAVVTHINLGSGFVLITSGVDLTGGVYQFTKAGVGVYTIKADGTWTFDPATNQSNNVTPVDAGFSYRITDGDTDISEAVQPINVTDGANPGAGGNVALTLAEAALDITQGGSDLAAGSVNGSNPSSTAETQVVLAASGLHFSAGSDAITSVAFSLASAPIVSGLEPGYSISWAINGSGQMVGSLIGPGSVNLGTAILVQLTGATGTTAAGGIADVGVTATLVGPLEHAYPPATQAAISISAIQVHASQADGDFGTGTVSITATDDGPTAVAAQSLSRTNSAGSTTKYLDADLDVDNNMGADGGKVIFTAATITGLATQALTSGTTPLSYSISTDGTVLTATKGSGGPTVFTIELQPTGSPDQYKLTMALPLDSVTTIDFDAGAYQFVGGNDPWAGFNTLANDNSQDLLLTPLGATGSSINGNANSAGAGGGGGGQNIGTGEGIRLDFVVDLGGNPNGSPSDYQNQIGQQDHTFDSHYLVNNASLTFGDGSTDTTISIRALLATDNAADSVLGNGSLVNIGSIAISFDGEIEVVSFNALTNPQTVTVGSVGGAADRNYTVEFVTVGSAQYVKVTGVLDTAVTIATLGSAQYNALEVKYLSGDDFAITDFGVAAQSTNPVNFTVPISVTDGDADTVTSGNLAITLTAAPPVVLDTNHDGSIGYLSIADGGHYDYNGDGNAEATAWVAAGDSILVRDADGNGTVSDASEFVFGGNGVTDMEALHAQYGEQLDASDADFVQFMLWNDANSNGVADAGELQSLTDAGVISIGLVSDGVSYVAVGGDVQVAGESTFSYVNDNGETSTGIAADVAFLTAQREADLAQRVAGTANSTGVVAAAVAAMG